MKGKRTVSALLTGVLLTGMLSTAAVAAQPQMELELKLSGDLTAGSTVTAQLWCENNPGMNSAQFTLGFDRAVLECTECKTGEALRGMMAATNPDGSQGAIVAAASALPVEGNGLLASYTFEVLKQGDCDFVLTNTGFKQPDGTVITYTVSGLDQDAGETESTAPSGGSGSSGSSGAEDKAPLFTDIAGHWAEEYLNTAGQRKLVAGYPDGRCGPEDLVTRAQFVTILWSDAGYPAPTKASDFTDLEPNMTYYHDAVAWAQERGYVAGVGDGLFQPNAPVSREQIAVILRQAAGSKNGDGLMFAGIYDKHFADSAQVSSWARDAVYWAVYNEVWCGKDAVAPGTQLKATQSASRAEIAVMMVNYQDKVER